MLKNIASPLFICVTQIVRRMCITQRLILEYFYYIYINILFPLYGLLHVRGR